MIKKEEYLKALEIVEQYHKQLELQIVSISEQVKKTNAKEWVRSIDCSGRLYNGVMHLIKKEYVEDITAKDILQLRGYGQSVLSEFEQLKKLTI